MAFAGWLDLLLLPVCLVCEAGLEEPRTDRFCGDCRGRWPPHDAGRPALRGVRPVLARWPYRGPVRELVVRAKEEPRSPALNWLSDELAALARAACAEPGGVVAVPPSRRRRRGRWHLSGALARELGVRLGWPAGPALRRAEERPPQAMLDGRRRRRNLSGSFRARGRGAVPRHAWVVDDVVTTGATLEECARALRALGVRSVGGLSLARVAAPGSRRVPGAP